MTPWFVADSLVLEGLWAGGLLVASVLVACLIVLGMRYARRKLEGRHKSAVAPEILRNLAGPVFLLLVLLGLLLAVSSFSYLETWRLNVVDAAIVLVIIFATLGLARSTRLLLGLYFRRKKVRQSVVRLTQRVTTLLVYVVGLLVLLDYLTISISPLVAGLGLGGLAVALALQPTLSNFFAGVQVVSDRMVQLGDYIELDNGARGYVVDVGWRTTRIRTAFNNMMMIPNSRLVDSIITNYHGPEMELAVIVESGVSYSSDLAKVENAAMEVAKEVIQDMPEAVKERDPWFAYDEFGDSNINFWVWLYAKDRISSFAVKSEVIKRLHARFDREGITINYPVRLLAYEDRKCKQSPLTPDVPSPGNPV